MKKKIIISIVALVVLLIGYIIFRIIFPSQSQKLSRLTGASLTLKVPDDFKKFIDVDFVVQKDGSTSKYFTYINKKGEIVTKEYRDRGWFEATIIWEGIDESQVK